MISHRPIVEFGRLHADAVAPLDAWYRTARRAKWRNFMEMRQDFRHADPVGGRTVFNIAGNKYRLIADVNYETQRIFVQAVLTHSEYDEESWKK